MLYATYAESNEQLKHCCYLVESLREFGAQLSDSPVYVFTPEAFSEVDKQLPDRLRDLGADLVVSPVPEESLWFYFSGKVYAAGLAEEVASGQDEILAWLDEDTIILRPPDEFSLPDEIQFAYRPVMHNRTGSLYDGPADEIWGRIYTILGVPESSLFPMVTPADGQTIRAYFNAGLLVVRSESGILRAWVEDFEKLYQDATLAELCQSNLDLRIFLHQMALVGAVLANPKIDGLLRLPEQYNYPIFFHQQFDATRDFGSIEDVVTLRYDTYFRDPDPDWRNRLIGPADKIQWLSDRLGT